MKKILLTFAIALFALTGWGQNATDLFFSEYVEGSSNNKYIEIFNGTGATVDLSDYSVLLFANGSPTATNTMILSGTLNNGEVIVIKNTSATIFLGTAIVGSVTNYNGDDALALKKISTNEYIDIFGSIGHDPGTAWTGTDGYTTVDKTLIRKHTVLQGISVNPVTGFPTLNSEWVMADIDYVSNLGKHVYGTYTNSVTLIAPNGGEIFTAGEKVNLQWTNNLVSQVKFDVLTSDGWENIIPGPIDATLSELEFTIPANAWSWNGYKIRIVDFSAPFIYDESNATFTINGHNKELIYEEFTSTLGSFSQQSSSGDQVWLKSSYGGVNFAKMTGKVTSPTPITYYANRDWLISSPINMDNTTGELLVFKTAKGDEGEALKVAYSSNYTGTGDPAAATWTYIDPSKYALSTGSYAWTNSGYIDMASVNGTIYLAFEYNSEAVATNCATWEVTDIHMSGIAGWALAVDRPVKKQQLFVANPVTDKMKIVSEKAISSITFYSISGKMAKQVYNPANYEVAVADLANGMYLVQIKFQDGTSSTAKVVKK